MRYVLTLILALLALPAAAQQIDFSPQPTEDCIANQRLPGATADALCIGEAARACFTAIPNASDTEIAMCMGLEAEYWHQRMRTAYARMLALSEAADAAFFETVETDAVRFSLVADLEQMQAQWEDWREIRCAVEAVMRRGLPHRMSAAASCTMRRTGEQALFLERAVKFMEMQQ
jgi:uncharacterized protein YecT (DUF1311 family)